MTNVKITGFTAAMISTLFLGAVGIFVRNISANAYIITFSRVLIGLIFLIIFLSLKKQLHHIKETKVSFSILATGFLLSLGILCYTNAINNTSLANAAFLLYLAPVIAVALAAVLLKEKFTLRNGLLLGFAFLGFLFIIEFQFLFDLEESKGYLWAMGSALCYALFIVLNRNITATVPALTRSFYQLLFAALVMLPFIDDSILDLTKSDYYWLIAVGFFQGFLATTLLIFAIKCLKTIEYGTISYIEPLVATIIGYLLYSENLTLLQFIGCTIVLASGVILVISSKNNKNLSTKSPQNV